MTTLVLKKYLFYFFPLELPLAHYFLTFSTKITSASISLGNAATPSTKLIQTVTELCKFSLPSTSLAVEEGWYCVLTLPVIGSLV